MVAIDLPSPVVEAINGWYARHPDGGDSPSLRCSALGHECERLLWYGLHWAIGADILSHEEDADKGRMRRLFETGDFEEMRLVDNLRAIGCTVLDRDPQTGKQWRVEFLQGHLTGSTDGLVTGVPGAPVVEHLLECKTHNDKSFGQLAKYGVADAKPMHWAQMQIYMHGCGLTRALYLAKNKNNDDLYAERVEYDAAAAMRLVAKAERIIDRESAPAKLHEDPDAKMAWSTCRNCHARPVCHGGEWGRRNCRTCLHSSVVSDVAGWFCTRHGRQLSLTDQAAGCPSHLYIIDLVPGEQVDVDSTAETVTYRLADGSTWVDGEVRS